MSQAELRMTTLKNKFDDLCYKLAAPKTAAEAPADNPAARAIARQQQPQYTLGNFKAAVATKVIPSGTTPKEIALGADITIQTIIETLERESLDLIQREKAAYDAINREPNHLW